MKYTSLLIIFSLLIPAISFAQKGFDESQSAYHPSPATYQKVSLRIPIPTDENKVSNAILEHFNWLGENGFGLKFQFHKSSQFAEHYTFQQAINGIPVYQQNVKANLDKTGRIFSLMNNLLQVPMAAPGGFEQSESAAISHVKSLYEGHTENFETWASACYFYIEGVFHPAYRIEYTHGTSVWESVVDARDFRTWSRRDLASNHHRITGGDTTGTGMVFSPDPLTTSGMVYGSTGDWEDNNDADNAALNGERVQVTLKGLCYTGGLFRLDGPYVTVQELESPSSNIATSSDGNFDYTRNEQGFEDVMVYYHIDTMQRYLQGLGYLNLYNEPILVDAHGLNGQDNSHFVPQGGSARLAFGEGCVDDAEDADVIVHEYGHALSHAASPGTNSGNERQGLDEGIGDYLAASYSKAISYTFWKNTFTWDGHNPCWTGRNASDPTPYPPSTTNLYTFGAIWASTLMEVHDVVGREVSDMVFFQSLFGNNSNMSLTDAALGILDADSLIYGGAHTSQYQAAFCSRGILSGTNCLVDLEDPSLVHKNWITWPNPAMESVQIKLNFPSNSREYHFGLHNLHGQKVAEIDFHQSQAFLDVSDLAPGIYLGSLFQKDQLLGVKKVVVE